MVTLPTRVPTITARSTDCLTANTKYYYVSTNEDGTTTIPDSFRCDLIFHQLLTVDKN